MIYKFLDQASRSAPGKNKNIIYLLLCRLLYGNDIIIIGNAIVILSYQE